MVTMEYGNSSLQLPLSKTRGFERGGMRLWFVGEESINVGKYLGIYPRLGIV